MNQNWFLLATIVIFIHGCGNNTEQTNQAAKISILTPLDSKTYNSPVNIKFGIENFLLAPAGTFAAGSGHHHLLVNTELPPMDRPIPTDENHLHFGKAQTETSLELPQGTHTLQLVLGDGSHIPHNPPIISERITIKVE
ncbi:MAG: DUF4399 domain-containing protein [Pseudomonadota bacterium]|nr:DUF4399 domain-containing protein [Pseudomonadota bacterium]